jgi:KUP system potassium uptake protein
MMTRAANPGASDSRQTRIYTLLLGALGVVYGDIGTSPLYAFKQSVGALGAPTPREVLGVLSLIAWALFLVVTVKYVLVIMRAHNRGEGGILALTALALRVFASGGATDRWRYCIVMAGMVGAAFFYGDGVITPAISVLSAVEGLKVATPLFESYVVPISLALLIGLFAFQRRGTARVGGLFGPVMLLWFVVLGLLGAMQIVQQPNILRAVNPLHGLNLLASAPWRGFMLLGSVVLAITGAEALYADIGHFGARPVRVAWLWFVFPALLLNYFGQGALVLAEPGAADNPFYRLAPDWALYPMVFLSSAATIIASQAVISDAFSITRQAVQLGYLPRLRVQHTSEEEIGQVYVPSVNTGLLVAVVLVVLTFGSSDALGAAYGIAVTGTMAITTTLAFIYFRGVVGWSLARAGPIFGLFLLIDLAFFGANLLKIFEGGWFPVAVAAVIGAIMATWWRGRQAVAAARARDAIPLWSFIDRGDADRMRRIPGTAIFVTSHNDAVPNALLHALKHFKSLHERAVVMTVRTEDVPAVSDERRLDIQELGHGFYTVTLHFGFMQHPNVPRALKECPANPALRLDWINTSVIVGREKILASERQGILPRWRKRLFILMNKLALDATEFFCIPPDRVVELGGQIEI